MIPHHHSLKIYGDKGSIVHDIRGAILASSRSKTKKLLNFNYQTNNKKKLNILKSFVEDLMNNRKKKINVNFDSIVNSMLVSLAIEKSIIKNKKIKINYKKLYLDD